MSEAQREHTPSELREGVRAGILTSLQRDTDLRGGRTARRLLLAGAVGAVGAVGVTLLVAGHPYGHHPSWHAVWFGAAWTGLLVVAAALVLLEVRTPTLPLARGAAVAVIGLGLAGLCGTLCPDQHFLHWWADTGAGRHLTGAGGPALGALCFGVVTALGVGAGAALLAPRPAHGPVLRPLLPAAMLLGLLAPGVTLQSIGTSWGVFGAWLTGSAAGAYAGVAGGLWIRSWLGRSGAP